VKGVGLKTIGGSAYHSSDRLDNID